MMHGWWSESTDGPKGGWSGCSHPTHNCWMYCSVCSVVYLYLYYSAVLVQSNVIVSVM